ARADHHQARQPDRPLAARPLTGSGAHYRQLITGAAAGMQTVSRSWQLAPAVARVAQLTVGADVCPGIGRTVPSALTVALAVHGGGPAHPPPHSSPTVTFCSTVADPHESPAGRFGSSSE